MPIHWLLYSFQMYSRTIKYLYDQSHVRICSKCAECKISHSQHQQRTRREVRLQKSSWSCCPVEAPGSFWRPKRSDSHAYIWRSPKYEPSPFARRNHDASSGGGGGSLDKSRLVTYLVGINNSLSISFVQSKKKVFLSSIKLRSFRINVDPYEYCYSETKTPEKHSRVNSVNRMIETKRVEVTTESSVVHTLEFLIYIYIYIHTTTIKHAVLLWIWPPKPDHRIAWKRAFLRLV